MDVKIKSEEGNFKMRVAGLVIKEGKLLTVNICNNGFFCLPGGHVHLGESSEEAIKREIGEEVGLTCKSIKMLALIENFFKSVKGVVTHEVCYFYMVEPNEDIKTEDYTYVENDEGELKNLEFKWFDLNKLDKMDFRPSALGKKLAKNDFEFEHIITKDF